MLVVFRLSGTTLINSLNNILLMQYTNTIQMAITSGMTVNNNILLQNEQYFYRGRVTVILQRSQTKQIAVRGRQSSLQLQTEQHTDRQLVLMRSYRLKPKPQSILKLLQTLTKRLTDAFLMLCSSRAPTSRAYFEYNTDSIT